MHFFKLERKLKLLFYYDKTIFIGIVVQVGHFGTYRGRNIIALKIVMS